MPSRAQMRRVTFFSSNMVKWAGINLSVIPGDGKPTRSGTELNNHLLSFLCIQLKLDCMIICTSCPNPQLSSEPLNIL